MYKTKIKKLFDSTGDLFSNSSQNFFRKFELPKSGCRFYAGVYSTLKKALKKSVNNRPGTIHIFKYLVRVVSVNSPDLKTSDYRSILQIFIT